MRLLSWILRIIAVAFILRLILRAIFPRPHAKRPRPGRRVPERLGGALVRDPQCGVYIPESRAITVTASGGTVHFCSDSCRDKWQRAQAQPARSA